MKIVVLVLTLVAFTYATVFHTKSSRHQADDEFLTRQKNIWKLLIDVGHSTNISLDFDFDIAANVDRYKDSNVVKAFLHDYKYGFLPKDEIFSMHCKKTRHQTIKLFDLLFFAKDFDTFYKTASWARMHLNGEQFVYALYVASYHRHDCRGITLPSLYEIFPNYFVPTETMQQVFDARLEGQTEIKVYVNNTGWEGSWHDGMYNAVLLGRFDNVNRNTEERISYFREDVGLNDFFGQFFLLYPPWLEQEKYETIHYFRRGEVFYYVLQQLFARYTLERFANAMPETEMLFWNKPIKVGYNPRVMATTGHVLHLRSENMIPDDFNPMGAYRTDSYEKRVTEALDLTRFFVEKNSSWVRVNHSSGIDTVGNVLWATPDSASVNYYGSFFTQGMKTLGYMLKTGSDREMVPGAIGNFLTATRDPAFYMFLHRIVRLMQHHKKYIRYYSTKELAFPGVKVESMEVDPLITYFNRFQFEIANGVPLTFSFHYVAKQFRLSHKPFNYKITVSSNKTSDAMVRVFIGPKYDSEGHVMTIEQSRMAYVELDRFPVQLKNGKNVIERNSKESPAFTEDNDGFSSKISKVVEALRKKEPYYVTDSIRCGMPERLMLPKGWGSGQPFIMYAIVNSYDKKYTSSPNEKIFDDYILCGGSKYYDYRPFGFPFDLSVPFDDDFKTSNMIFKDVLIYHKDEREINNV